MRRIFQSTPSTRRETWTTRYYGYGDFISIHSLHTEGDRGISRIVILSHHFNPLPPHGGRRNISSRPAVRLYFNPLPPHGGRLKMTAGEYDGVIFQSTPSTRRETRVVALYQQLEDISIHSLHTEGDWKCMKRSERNEYFNPLPPHGGRPSAAKQVILTLAFQSTPSTRRETVCRLDVYGSIPISIHSLHTEGDQHPMRRYHCQIGFQSTPSTRRETVEVFPFVRRNCISIHSLHTEGDVDQFSRFSGS